MNAQQKDQALAIQIAERLNPGATDNGWHPLGVKLERAARTLRRAQLTLRNWATEECNGTIQREGSEGTGQPFRHYGNGTKGPFLTIKIADRERGALARVEKVCKEFGLHYYQQGDPRGCALYVDIKPFRDHNYNNGIACI